MQDAARYAPRILSLRDTALRVPASAPSKIAAHFALCYKRIMLSRYECALRACYAPVSVMLLLLLALRARCRAIAVVAACERCLRAMPTAVLRYVYQYARASVRFVHYAAAHVAFATVFFFFFTSRCLLALFAAAVCHAYAFVARRLCLFRPFFAMPAPPCHAMSLAFAVARAAC